MNRITYYIKKKQKEKEYIKYINEHLENIEKAFVEMVMCPDMDWFPWEFYHADLYEQLQEHDKSKFSDEEFNAYRKQYHPVDSEERILNEKDFEKAWEHHYKNNRHHWQCRQYDECLNDEITKEQMLDCLENIVDWMAMGYKFKNRPYQFYEKNKDKIKLPEAQRNFMEKIIYEGIDKRYIKKGE